MTIKKLVLVSSGNNNKFYDMSNLGTGTFEVSYGRIGVTCTKKTYPISRWDEIYRQKLGKGYQDVTDLAAKTQIRVLEKYKEIPDDGVNRLIEHLRAVARDTVQKNYTVASEAVSAAMVREAQLVLDELSNLSLSVSAFNQKLLTLFAVIPRRMGKVPDYLATSITQYESIVQREQSLLDVMAGQVSDDIVTIEKAGDESRTVLEVFGLEVSPATDADIVRIKKELGKDSVRQFAQAWRVENKTTRKNFKAFCAGKGRLAKKLFWHGSRTENWWGILRAGLALRPTSAIINGKMFGQGLYFAPLAKKSIGYTSIHGSHWAHGSSPTGFLALYEVAYGKPYDVFDNNGCSNMTYETLQRVAPGCSCLHVHAGRVLFNDEVVVYREDQTTIKYLVELKA